MGLELYMIGLMVRDMTASLQFYRRLGLDIPEGSEANSHVEIQMGNMSFFLDANPKIWDSEFDTNPEVNQSTHSAHYPMILEFYLKEAHILENKFTELVGYGYQGYRKPYKTSFGMCFAMVKDPDGNTILLSADAANALDV
jgi:catechol 2,3-dioxygenase-like lactoylglutathione lyase family enzyme